MSQEPVTTRPLISEPFRIFALWARTIGLTTARYGFYIRGLCFALTLLVGSPIRYWPFENDWDSTWLYALNFAAAHHLTFGTDVIWTVGPLGYLTFPQDMWRNLEFGISFQIALWLIVTVALWPLFFRYSLTLPHCILFTFF